MMSLARLVCVFTIFILATANAFAHPAQVLLVRHAEKGDNGDLSDRGYQRAQALPQLFTRPEFTTFGKPVALYAMNPTSDGKQKRAVETLQYLAPALNLPIDQDYNKEDVQPLVNEIMGDDNFQGKAVLICWEHKVLEQIAAAFGVADVPKWDDDTFDRVWVINFAGDGSTSFQDLPESLLPGDSRK